MKKLLGVLSSFALTSSSVTCIIACKTDKKELKDLAENLAIESLNTAKDFKAKLIDKIKAESGFDSVSDTEINITKKDGSDLQDSDVTGTVIEIKIKAKSDAEKISGEKDVKVTWSLKTKTVVKKNLTALNSTVTFTSLKTIDDFTNKLLAKAKESKTDLSSLVKTNVKFFKADGTTELTNITDIQTGLIYIIKANTADTVFQGQQSINVTWTEQTEQVRKNLTALNLTVTFTSLKTIDDFTNKLLAKAKESKTDLSSLTKTNVKFFKADGTTELTNITDIQTGLTYIIKANTADTVFQGQQSINVNWTEQVRKNLTALNSTVTFTSLKTIDDFTNKLLAEAKESNTDLSSLTKTNVKFFKADGTTELTNITDIQTGLTYIIKANTADTVFQGQQSINVNWTQTSLNNLTNVIIESRREVEDFKSKLIIELKKQISAITDINTNILQTNDDPWEQSNIVASTNVKIKANGTDFVGEKIITVTWTEQS